MNQIFFDSWDSIVRTIVITIMSYVLLIFLLRTSGKRTLSKMNAFDFIVTIALGSTLATVMLNKNVALIDGVLAFFLLIYLQYLITWLSTRYRKVSQLIKSTPTLLVYKGVMLKELMQKERIVEDEIFAAARQNNFGSIAEIDAVILESDGSLTVIKQIPGLHTEVFKNIIRPEKLE